MPESVSLPLRGQLENARQLERQVDKIAKRASKNLKIDFTGSGKNLESLAQPLGRITGKADEFGKSMEAANARVIAFGASVGILSAVTKSFKALVSTTIEVEKSLAKINSILNTNVAGLDKLKGQIFDIARGTEQTFDTVAEAALELSRQGLSATEVTKRLNDSLVLARLSGVSAADAVGSLTAAVNGFSKSGLTTSEILNKVSAAANKFAVSERDLFEGFKRSASVAQQAGVSLDELGGIITAVQQKTARGGAVIGNSLKTIFTRIGKPESVTLLRELGVEITNVEGNLLPATQVIENLAKSFDTLNEAQQRQVAFKIGGGFQIAPLLAALQDYGEESSIAIKATEAFANATDEAYKKNIVLNKTLAAGIQSTSLSVQELANALGELGVTDVFGTLLTSIGGVVEKITGVLKGDDLGSTFARGLVKGVSSLILPALGLVVVIIGKLTKDLLKFGANSLKTFLGLGNAAERLKSVEERTYQILLNNSDVRKQILTIENASISAEQKKVLQSELFTKSLLAQKSVLLELQQISSRVAPGVIAGVAGGRSSKISRSAGGFLPVGAEQKDISRGVGGAPSGAKPVVIPNFAFGGGQKGTMVANSSEYIVPNFAGGGSAIFNQDMVKSMGLPGGAKKINAAGGFIPNFVTPFIRPSTPLGQRTDISTRDEAISAGYSAFAVSSRFGKAKTKTPTFNTYNANTNPKSAVMLTPEPIKFLPGGVNLKYTKDRFIKTPSSSKVKVSQFLGGFAGIDPSLNENNSEFADLLKLDKNIDDSLANAANDTLNSFDELVPELKIKPANYDSKEIKKLFLKEGGSGALTAYKGAIFEGLINAISGGVETENDSSLDIQFRGTSGKILEEIFGLEGKGFEFGDFKASDSQGNKDKYRNQLFKNLPKELEKKAITKREKRPDELSSAAKARGKAASGYIPNFAMSPIDDAIQREKDAGVPVNQIRINQSGKLRNSQNPNGIAVTNTRDEPTGAIPQNAARGYIHNFAADQPSGGFKGFDKRTIKAQQDYSDSLNKSSDSLKKQTSEVKDNSGRMFALSTAAFAVQGALSGMSQEATGFTKNLGQAAAGLSGMLTTVLLFQGLNTKPGFRQNKDATFGAGLRDRGRAQRSAGIGRLGTRGSTLSGAASFAIGGTKAGLGKLTLGFSRLVPILGTAVLAFQGLGAILKLFGFDLNKFVGEKLSKLGQAFGIIDTPAEKAAKSLEELNKQASKNLLGRTDGPKSLTKQILKDLQEGVKDKSGKIITEPTEKIAQIVRNRQENIQGSSRTFFKEVNQGGGGGISKKFANINGENIRIDKATFDSINKLAPEIRKQFDNAILATISDLDLQGLNGDTSPEQVAKLIEKQLGRLSKEDRSKLLRLRGDRNVVEGQLAVGVPNIEKRNALQKQRKDIIAEIAKLEGKIADLSKQDDKVLVSKKRVLKINADIAKIQSESAFNTRLAIAGSESELETRLKIKNTLKETTDLEKFGNTTTLKRLESERKFRVQAAKETKKLLDAQGAVKSVLTPNDDQELNVEELKKYNDALDSISNKILNNGKISKEEIKNILTKTGLVEKESDLLDTIAGKAFAQLSATKQIATVELGILETTRSRAKLEELSAQNRERQLKSAERLLTADTRRINRNKESQDLADQIKIAGIRSQGIGGNSRAGASVQRQVAEVERDAKIREAGQSTVKAQEKLQTDFISILREAGAKISKQDVEGFREAKSTNGDFLQFQNILDRTAKEKKQEQIQALELQKANISNTLLNGSAAQINATAAKLQLQAAQLNAGKSVVDAATSSSGASTGGDAGTSIDVDKEALREYRKQLEEQLKKVKEADLSGFLGKGEDAVLDLAKTVEVNGQKIILANLQFGNALAESGASLTTFANLVRAEFNSIADQKAQNAFTLATSADPSAIEGSLASKSRISTLETASGTGSEKIKQANELALFQQKELDLIEAKDAATRVSLEFEYDKKLEIIALARDFDDLNSKEPGYAEKVFEIRKKIAAIKAKDQSLSEKLASRGASNEEIAESYENTFVDASERFVDNLSNGMADAIQKGGDLGDVLQNVALEFFSTMAAEAQKLLLNKLFFGGGSSDSSGGSGGGGIIGSLVGAFTKNPKASGGMITGGSGSKDDVPALLMGGEYVMKKNAVNKYGSNFMESINNGKAPKGIQKFAEGGMVDSQSFEMPSFLKTQGSTGSFNGTSVQKFANGGMVIPEEEKIQSGKGGFFVPGTYGGQIKGKQQLLDFAGQAFTSGERDVISSSSDQFGGASQISLESESVRLTNRGRNMGTPLQKATQEAKQQGFGLYEQQIELEKQLEEQRKARKKQIKQMWVNAAISIAASGIGAKAGSAAKGAGGALAKAAPAIQSGTSGLIGTALKGGLFGYDQTGLDVKAGGALNFGPGRNIGNDEDLFYALQNDPTGPLSKVSDLSEIYNNAPKMELVPEFNNLKLATGGSIPEAAGVDTVPAMLSGGEFVMNSAATSRIGEGNLKKMNSGVGGSDESGSGSSEALVSKLDELIQATKESTGEINITVNGQSGEEEESSKDADNKSLEMAKQLKEQVLKVIKDEKRLGGSLRDM